MRPAAHATARGSPWLHLLSGAKIALTGDYGDFIHTPFGRRARRRRHHERHAGGACTGRHLFDSKELIMRRTLRSTLLREVLAALIIIMAIGIVLSLEIAF
jgi:hypothetical protein